MIAQRNPRECLHRDLIDYVGLLSEDSVHELSRGDIISWLAREEPDYWVVHQPAWTLEAAAAQPWFALAYQPVWSGGTVVIWKHIRTIAEAKSLEQAAVEPAAATFADELGVPESDTTARNALASLLAVYSTRPDLQHAYVTGQRFNLAGLLTWAGGSQPDTDSSGAAIENYAATYRALTPRTTATYAPPQLLIA